MASTALAMRALHCIAARCKNAPPYVASGWYFIGTYNPAQKVTNMQSVTAAENREASTVKTSTIRPEYTSYTSSFHVAMARSRMLTDIC